VIDRVQSVLSFEGGSYAYFACGCNKFEVPKVILSARDRWRARVPKVKEFCHII